MPLRLQRYFSFKNQKKLFLILRKEFKNNR